MRIEDIYQLFTKSTGVCTDTRKIEKNNIYIALKGDNFNGNKFANQAIENGALACFVDEPLYEDRTNHIYLIDDGLSTLQDLAKYHRQQLAIPFIGLTGSNGKTTTKELIATCLGAKYSVAYTKGNLNNHIGVPLTLLSISRADDIAVIEMGANHLGEIAELCEIAQPNFGYITNFGKAHLEGFGSIEGVIKGKSELYHFLSGRDGMAFINEDDPIQLQKAQALKQIRFGFNGSPDYVYSRTSQNGIASISYNNTDLRTHLSGTYNEINIAAAATIAMYFNVTIDQIQSALQAYHPNLNRSQEMVKSNYKILLDAYNANPTSMEAALRNFATLDGTKTIILGDMFELGSDSKVEHENIAQLARDLQFESIFLIGDQFHQVSTEDGHIHRFKSCASFAQYLHTHRISTQRILIKGSRGMALEKLLDHID